MTDYSLNCLEKQYIHYPQEGGNSFIEQEMNELCILPRRQYKNRVKRSSDKI